jgi:hypothetical protein
VMGREHGCLPRWGPCTLVLVMTRHWGLVLLFSESRCGPHTDTRKVITIMLTLCQQHLSQDLPGVLLNTFILPPPFLEKELDSLPPGHRAAQQPEVQFWELS